METHRKLTPNTCAAAGGIRAIRVGMCSSRMMRKVSDREVWRGHRLGPVGVCKLTGGGRETLVDDAGDLPESVFERRRNAPTWGFTPYACMQRDRLAPSHTSSQQESTMSANTQVQRPVGPHRRVIGLDMHPELFSAAALSGPDAHRATVHWVHDRVGRMQFDAWLRRHVEPQDLIVIEASGNTFATVDQIRAAGRQAIVLESLRAGQVRKAYCNTDKLSAVKLARVYLSGLAHEVWTPDETTRARREVFFSHRRTVKDTTMGRNRIRSWLTDHGLRAPRGLRLTQASGRDWVLNRREWTPTQQLLIEQLFTDLWQAEARRKKLRAIMAEEVTTDPQILQLIRLLGVRHITAYALVAIIGDINRFRTPKQLVAYVGLNPRVKLSGNGGSVGALAHNGRSDLRVLLIQAAHSILRYGSGPSHRWALKLVCSKGRNLAACAVARKLLVACWYLLQGCFTPMQDASQTIRTKIHKLASAIGASRIRQLGFKTLSQFESEKLQVLMSYA